MKRQPKKSLQLATETLRSLRDGLLQSVDGAGSGKPTGGAGQSCGRGCKA